MGCCITFKGISRDCNTNIGGIKKAWIACYDDVKSLEFCDPKTKDRVNGITYAEGANHGSWNEFEFRKQTGSVTTTPNKDDATGTLFYETVISLVFSRWNTAKRLEMEALGLSDLAVIVQDNNNKFWYYGYDYYMTLAGGTFETGTAFGDMNGYTVELNCVSKYSGIQVSPSVMKDIISYELGEDVEPEGE